MQFIPLLTERKEGVTDLRLISWRAIDSSTIEVFSSRMLRQRRDFYRLQTRLIGWLIRLPGRNQWLGSPFDTPNISLLTNVGKDS